ncbi:hypothetical protein ACRAWF_33570 [Streptomyces sp. L7]
MYPSPAPSFLDIIFTGLRIPLLSARVTRVLGLAGWGRARVAWRTWPRPWPPALGLAHPPRRSAFGDDHYGEYWGWDALEQGEGTGPSPSLLPL